MNISVSKCISKREVKVLYVYGKQTDSNGTITKVKCYDASSNSSSWITVKEISKMLLDGTVFAYAGKYDSLSHEFKNICVVVPMIKDGDYYITSVTDDKKTNNLEALPVYEK
jgi:hypothetical protein